MAKKSELKAEERMEVLALLRREESAAAQNSATPTTAPEAVRNLQ